MDYKKLDYQKSAQRFLDCAREAAAAGNGTAGWLAAVDYLVRESKGTARVNKIEVEKLARQGHINLANYYLEDAEERKAQGKEYSSPLYLASCEVAQAGGLDAAKIDPKRWAAVAGVRYARGRAIGGLTFAQVVAAATVGEEKWIKAARAPNALTLTT